MKKTLFTLLLLISVQVIGQQHLLSEIDYFHQSNSEITVKATINAQIDSASLKSETTRLIIQLPGFKSITVIKSKVAIHENKSLSWFGVVEGDSQSSVNFVIINEAIHGSIFTKNAVYEIKSIGGGVIQIDEMNPQAFDSCEGQMDPHELNLPKMYSKPPQKEQNKVGNLTLDVLIVYSNDTLAAVGDHDSIVAIAQASIDNMNISLSNSLLTAGINEVRLLDVVAVDRDESGSLSTEVNWLAGNFEVRTIRNEVGADMVSMLTAVGGCGLGVVMRNPGAFFSESAYQVTKHSCAVSGLSMAHEFGHNLGLEHDPAHGTSPENASFPYSFGYFHDGEYRTIMSYSSACTVFCPREMHYSNPQQTFNGFPTGAENTNDNVRTLEQTSLIAVDFRIHIEDNIYANGFE